MPGQRCDALQGRPSGSKRRLAPEADINAPPAARPRPPKRRAIAQRGGEPVLPDASFIPLSIALDGDAPAAGRRLRIRAAAHEDKGAGGPSTSATPTEALVVRDLPFTWRPPAVVLRALMSAFGPVAGVAVDPVDARSAVVLFEGGGGGGGGGVEAALAAARAGRVVGVGVGLPRVEGPVGLKAWVEGHTAHFPGTDALQAEVKCGPPFAGWGGVGWGGVDMERRRSFPTSHLSPLFSFWTGRRLDGRL